MEFDHNGKPQRRKNKDTTCFNIHKPRKKGIKWRIKRRMREEDGCLEEVDEKTEVEQKKRIRNQPHTLQCIKESTSYIV